jgi:hypothetical protein
MIKKAYKDMTAKEAELFYGKETWKKMGASKCLDGITCAFSGNGELIIYKEDLDNAYFKVMTGTVKFCD